MSSSQKAGGGVEALAFGRTGALVGVGGGGISTVLAGVDEAGAAGAAGVEGDDEHASALTSREVGTSAFIGVE